MNASASTTHLNNKEKASLLQSVLQSFCPPHRLLIFCFNRILEWPAEDIVKELFDLKLREIEAILKKSLIQSGIAEETVQSGFKNFHQIWDWEKELIKLFKDEEANPGWLKNPELKGARISEIKLKAFFVYHAEGEAIETSPPEENAKLITLAQELIEYWNKDEELKWINEAHRGNEQAFGRLLRVYEKQIYGYIRARSRNDDKARIIATNTWTQIWKQFKAFNPAFSAFADFVKNRASYRSRDLPPESHKSAKTSRIKIPLEELKDSPVLMFDPTGEIIRSLDKKRLYGILFKLAFGSTGPPHELIAFGLRDLRAIAAKEIVSQHAGKKLRLLTNSLEENCPGITDLPKERVQLYLRPLREKLDKQFKDLKIHKKTKDQYLTLYELITGETMLRQYFIGDQEADFGKNLADWCRHTQLRVRAAVTPADRQEYADAS